MNKRVGENFGGNCLAGSAWGALSTGISNGQVTTERAVPLLTSGGGQCPSNVSQLSEQQIMYTLDQGALNLYNV